MPTRRREREGGEGEDASSGLNQQKLTGSRWEEVVEEKREEELEASRPATGLKDLMNGGTGPPEPKRKAGRSAQLRRVGRAHGLGAWVNRQPTLAPSGVGSTVDVSSRRALSRAARQRKAFFVVSKKKMKNKINKNKRTIIHETSHHRTFFSPNRLPCHDVDSGPRHQHQGLPVLGTLQPAWTLPSLSPLTGQTLNAKKASLVL